MQTQPGKSNAAARQSQSKTARKEKGLHCMLLSIVHILKAYQASLRLFTKGDPRYRQIFPQSVYAELNKSKFSYFVGVHVDAD